ncbi:MAG: hypothetical protein ACLQBJ_15745, partial [Bryobacteraceae bacterium]
ALTDFEDPADYHATLADYLADLRPAGAVEIELVHRLVKDLWKLRRLERLERAFLVDTIEQADRRLDSPIPEQQAFLACSTELHSQFRHYKGETPLERVELLQHRLRRAADSTLRLITDLQAERRAAPDAASHPWVEVSTLPPDSMAYRVDEPPAFCDTIAVPDTVPAAPAPDSPDAPPDQSDPTNAPSLADAESSSPDTPPAPLSDPPNAHESHETPSATPSIHKTNSTFSFVPPKMQSTPPPHPAKPTPKPAPKRAA